MSDSLTSLREALTDAPALDPGAALEDAFEERATAAGAAVYRVPDGEDHDAVVGEILASIDPVRIALSTDPEARQACLYFGAGAVSGETDRAVLEQCAIGVTRAHAAVADLGAIVLERGANEHRLGVLVPRVVVALVARADLVGPLDAVPGASGPEALAIVAGPSRTAAAQSGDGSPLVRVPEETHIVFYGG